jgi:hypothetical protein
MRGISKRRQPAPTWICNSDGKARGVEASVGACSDRELLLDAPGAFVDS